jgi:O-antigen/teichoic acid export membrane protein
VAGFFGTLSAEGRKFILGAFLNPAAVALVEKAQQVQTLSRQALILPVARVLLPSLSKDIRQERSIGPKIETLISFTVIIIWPLFLSISLLAVPLIEIVFGENWTVAGEILPYFLCAGAIVACLPQPEQILIPHGLVRRLTVLRLLQALLVFCLAVIGAMHSLQFFAMLLPLEAALFLIGNYFAVRKWIGTTLRQLTSSYIKAGFISVCSALGPFVAFLAYGHAVPIHFVFLSLMVASLTWLLAVFVIRHPLSREISHIVRGLWRRGVDRVRRRSAHRSAVDASDRN